MGQLASACGVSDNNLWNRTMFSLLDHNNQIMINKLPEKLRPVLSISDLTSKVDSDLARKIYAANDKYDGDPDDTKREKILTELFALADVVVRFED